MDYEKPFKDILWSLIFRNIANYVTEIQFFSDGWNHFFPNQEFNSFVRLAHLCALFLKSLNSTKWPNVVSFKCGLTVSIHLLPEWTRVDILLPIST